MRGILGKDPELKTSKAETPYTGQSDDGKDIGQWLRVTCFNDAAKAIANRAKKGDRVYVEGSLTMNQWNDAHGEVRHGLSVAAWKCERVASIGKHKQPRQDNGTLAAYHKPDAGQTTNHEPELNDNLPW